MMAQNELALERMHEATVEFVKCKVDLDAVRHEMEVLKITARGLRDEVKRHLEDQRRPRSESGW